MTGVEVEEEDCWMSNNPCKAAGAIVDVDDVHCIGTSNMV